MKNEVPKGAIIAIGVALVLLIGFAAFKKFGGDPNASTATPQQIDQVKQMRSTIMAPGVHRDSEGHFVDAEGKPVDTSPKVKGQ